MSTTTNNDRLLKDKAVDLQAHSVFFALVIGLVFYCNLRIDWILRTTVVVLCYGGWATTMVLFIIGAIRSFKSGKPDKAT